MKCLLRCCPAILIAIAMSLMVPSGADAQGGGETCATATEIPCGTVSVATNTTTAVNDYDQGANCTAYGSAGPDVVYRIDLEPNAALDLTFTGPYDASVYLITDCGNPAGTCVAGSDTFPPGVPDNLVYTNGPGGVQTLYLIIDGFDELSFGPGALAGTIGCGGIGEPTGACCNRTSGACGIASAPGCATSNGIYQGDGSDCLPSPCPPPESRCVLPGLQVASDPAGDATGGVRQLDVLGVSVAEPYFTDGIERIVLTLTLANADPDSLPPNALWRVSFTADTSPADTAFYVSMNTCDPDFIPGYAFDFGYVDVGAGNLNRGLGVPESGVLLPNGEARITMRKTTVGNSGLGPVAFHVPVGTNLSAVVARSFVFVGAACSGVIQTVDSTPGSPAYAVKGNDYCKPHMVNCPVDFNGDADDGAIPLSFSVSNPSTAERRFTANISDTNDWVVGGPIDAEVTVAAGGTELVSAALQMTTDCEPLDTDEIFWVVTASDLPSPDNVQQCSTVATCTDVGGVEAAGAAAFSFGLLGSNPFRGEANLSYTLPERRQVKIEIYGVNGSLVRTLVDSEQGPGSFKVPFRLREAAGHRLSSGVYLVRMTAGKEVRTLRVVGLD